MPAPQTIDDFVPDDFAPDAADGADGFIPDDAVVKIPSGLGKPRSQLLREHQANLMAQPQPQKLIEENGRRRVADIAPSQIELGLEVLKAPFRALKGTAEAIPEVGKTLYEAGTRPADPESARKLFDLGHGMAEGVVDTGRKALGVYATPKEQAGAIGDIATMALTPELPKIAKAVPGVRRITSPVPYRAVASRTQGINEIVSALHPNARTARSLETAVPEIEKYLDANPGRKAAVDRKTGSIEGFASVSKDVSNQFINENYAPLQKMLKDATIRVGDREMTFGEGIARREELNKILGRLGYYDKHPIVQSLAKSVPAVQEAVNELEALRGVLNSTVDQMAPTNVGAANMLRKYADLKQISDVSAIRAERWKLMKMEEAGNTTPLRTYVNEAAQMLLAGAAGAMFLPFGAAGGATALLRPASLFRMSRMIKAGLQKPKIDPDILIRRAFKNIERGKSTIASEAPSAFVGKKGPLAEPIPVRGVPIKLPGSDTAAPVATPGEISARMQSGEFPSVREFPTHAPGTTGQPTLPFVPQEVGGIPQRPGGFEGNPAQNMVLPNELTNQFNEPMGPAKPTVTGAEAGSAYSNRAQQILENEPNLTPDQLAERMKTESIERPGQEFMPFVEQQIGGIPQDIRGMEGTPPQQTIPFSTPAEVEQAAMRDAVLQEAYRRQTSARAAANNAAWEAAQPAQVEIPQPAMGEGIGDRRLTDFNPAETGNAQPLPPTPPSGLMSFGGGGAGIEPLPPMPAPGSATPPPIETPPAPVEVPEAPAVVEPPPNPYLGPNRRRSNLDPAVLEENRRRSVEEGASRFLERRKSIGEAAITPGATISDEQNLRFLGHEGAADFVKTMDETAKESAGPKGTDRNIIPAAAPATPPPAVEPVKLPPTPTKRRSKVETTPVTKKRGKKESAPPFQSSIAPSTLDTSFKDQKTSLLSQIDTALKAEGLGGTKPVNLRVPGGGEYNITNTKEALTNFRERVSKRFPTNEGPKTPPKVRATSIKRLTGEGIEYYNPYKVRDQEVISTEGRRGRGSANYTHEGWFSNGHYAIKSEPPTGVTANDMPSLKDKVAPPKKLTPAQVQGEFYYEAPEEAAAPSKISYQPGAKSARPDLEAEAKPEPEAPKPETDDFQTQTPLAHVVGGKLEAILDAKYVDSILTKYPNAKPYLAEDSKLVYFRDGDQMVGVVAKIEGSKSGKGTLPSRFHERAKEVKLGVEPINLPGKKSK